MRSLAVALFLGVSTMTSFTAGTVNAARIPMAFDYEDGTVVGDAGLRVHEAAVDDVAGRAYVYATLDVGPVNPVKYVDGVPQLQPARGETRVVSAPTGTDAAGYFFRDLSALAENPEQPKHLQVVALGQQTDEGFTAAVKFGLADALRARYDEAYIAGWLFDGQLDYFGPYVRPVTPLDFKVRVDLQAQMMTAWASCRGDDEWTLLAENAPLMNAVTAIDGVQVEQQLGAAGVRSLMVRAKPWAPAEKVQPHPLAKPERIVCPSGGFKFHTMRSVWAQTGRHVAVSRMPEFHHGFPDVTLAGPNHLIAAWRNGAHSGGTGGLSIAHSYDGGHTWGEPTLAYPGGNCPRIQTLKDGTILLIIDVSNGGEYPVVMWDSTDEGKTWTNERWLRRSRREVIAAACPATSPNCPTARG